MQNKIELKEIKKNQTGLGLLIESDGYISMSEPTNLKIFEDVNTHGNDWHVPNPFIVSAVFQKFDIENANGRIYPEAVLKRQVDAYIEKYMKNKCATGEADHPDCYALDNKNNYILTSEGWKSFDDDLTLSQILTLNPETGVMEYKPLINTVKQHYKGKIIHLKGRLIDEKVTPNHKFVVYDRHNKFKGLYTAQDILDKKVPDQNHCYIPKTAEWSGLNDEYFTLSRLDEETIPKIIRNEYKDTLRKDINIPIKTWMKFMGIYLSEGHVDGTRNTGKVCVTQVKEDVSALIEELFIEMPFEFTVIKYKNDNRKVFCITDLRLSHYLKQFGKSHQKFVPDFIKNQSKENLQIFYDWFVLGDGRKRGRTSDVFSTSKQLALDLNEIQLKIGYCGSYHVDENRKDRIIKENGVERLIKEENSKPMHFTYKVLSKGIYLDERMLSVTEEDYEGEIFCVEVENHTWYAMINGVCHWTGNSSSISTRTISHDVVELHWEGHTLVGKLRIITSEGFRRYGVISCMGDMIANLLMNNVRIGVSSRGVGSVEQRMGKYYVGDDFELVCWDIVTQPSTPGSWIASDKGELSQFIENDQTKVSKSLIEEKLEKLKNIIDF